MATSAVSTTSSSNSTVAASSAASVAAANKAAAQKILTSLSAGSGVDTASLAQNLVDAERLPRENEINAKIAKNDAKVSGLSAVMFMMSELKNSLTAIKDKSSLNALQATSSNTAAFSVTADTTASTGNHEIEVVSLARGQKNITSTGFSSATQSLNRGVPFSFQIQSNNAGVSGGAAAPSALANAGLGGGDRVTGVTMGSVHDFSQFSLNVNGVALSVAPAPAGSTLADLAASLETKLQTADGSTDLTVSVSGSDLIVTSATNRLLTDATLNLTSTKILSPVFGSTPAVTDFKSFSLTIAGQQRTVTPAPATATLADLATNLQSQLRSLDGSSDVSVAVSGNDLVFTSASGRPLTSPVLSKIATVEMQPAGLSGGTGAGTGTGVTTGIATGDTLSGVSFGSIPGAQDFKSFKVTVNGATRVITPSAGLNSLAALTADLQSQLRTAEGNSNDLSVVIGADGQSIQVTSASGRSVSGLALSSAAISGVSFATAASISDFRGFGVTINGNVRTIVPAPGAATLSELAANLQLQLRGLDGTNDLSVTVEGSSLQFWSATGKPIVSPTLLANSYDLTPAGVAKAINAKGLGVTAEVVNTGAATNPYQLMLSGAAGSTQSFSLTSGIPELANSNIAGYVASDAVIKVDGVTMTRTTNTITDAVTGVTLNLKGKTTIGSPASLDLSRDTSAIKDKMTALVTAYNDANDILNQVSDPKSTLDTYGATLVGDSTVRLVRQQLRAMFQSKSSTPGAQVHSYWQLGLSVDEKGVMTLDATKLDASLQSNYSDVVKSLTGNYDKLSTSSTLPAGLAGDAVKKLTDMLGNSGPLMTRSENANTQNAKYKDDLVKLQARMDAMLARYTKQFAAMDSLVGQVNSQKTSLKSTFEGMMAMYTNK